MKSNSFLHFRFPLSFFIITFSVHQAKMITFWLCF